MKNLNNKQIIKINDLKFKKTPGMINFAKQTELKFITQKRMLSTHSTDTEFGIWWNKGVQISLCLKQLAIGFTFKNEKRKFLLYIEKRNFPGYRNDSIFNFD